MYLGMNHIMAVGFQIPNCSRRIERIWDCNWVLDLIKIYLIFRFYWFFVTLGFWGSLLSIETLYLRGISIYRCTPYYVGMYIRTYVWM